jgi:hypothetical protein
MPAQRSEATKQNEDAASGRSTPRPESALGAVTRRPPAAPAPRARMNPLLMSTAAILGLQRTIGNAAVSRLLQEARPSPARAATAVPVAQRMLMTHQTKSDEGVQIDELGQVGFINDYARWLAKDTAALAEGKPVGKPGLAATLKLAKVDGKKLQQEMVDSVIASKSWKELGDSDKDSLVAHVREKGELGDLDEGSTANDYIETYDFEGSYEDDIRSWVAAKMKLATAATVGDVAGANLPLAWHADLAYLVYEQTKGTYYGERSLEAFIPPFKKLIADVNDGKVEEFKFTRKYGAGSLNWGAEFIVERPADLKDKYDGKAVLHTHYPEGDAEPNYAHTKPEDKKYEPGFGYTIVDTTQVTSIDDTQEKWDDL